MHTDERKPLYEGKAKQIFAGPEEGLYVMRFKDSATAFDGVKKAEISKKGTLNQQIAAKMFEYLHENGVKTHYVKTLNEREMIVNAVEIIQIEVVLRNVAAGSLCKRLGFEQGKELNPPLVEFFLKDDALHDPLITEDHIRMMNLATDEEVVELRRLGLRINELMRTYFKKLGIQLVDFKLEFGRSPKGELLLADEITPDGCRLWDIGTGDILDKDRFRKDLGGLVEAYEVVWGRMQKGHA